MSFIEVLQSFGLPVGLLFVVGVAIWRAALWVGREVLKPMADRHIKFVDEVATVIKDQATVIATSNVNILKISEAIVVISKTNKDALERIEAVTAELQRVASGISEVRSIVLKTENVTLIPSRGKKNDSSGG